MRNKFNQISKPKVRAAINPAVAQQVAAKLAQGLAIHNCSGSIKPDTNLGGGNPP